MPSQLPPPRVSDQVARRDLYWRGNVAFQDPLSAVSNRGPFPRLRFFLTVFLCTRRRAEDGVAIMRRRVTFFNVSQFL
jgi:hypothetical protein